MQWLYLDQAATTGGGRSRSLDLAVSPRSRRRRPSGGGWRAVHGHRREPRVGRTRAAPGRRTGDPAGRNRREGRKARPAAGRTARRRGRDRPRRPAPADKQVPGARTTRRPPPGRPTRRPAGSRAAKQWSWSRASSPRRTERSPGPEGGEEGGRDRQRRARAPRATAGASGRFRMRSLHAAAARARQLAQAAGAGRAPPRPAPGTRRTSRGARRPPSRPPRRLPSTKKPVTLRFAAQRALPASASRRAPARWMRDMTVPTGTPERLGDLGVAQFLDVAQHHDRSERLGQGRSARSGPPPRKRGRPGAAGWPALAC
jgi:hypothetical protein